MSPEQYAVFTASLHIKPPWSWVRAVLGRLPKVLLDVRRMGKCACTRMRTIDDELVKRLSQNPFS